VGAEGSDDVFVISKEPGRNDHRDSFFWAVIELLQGSNNVKQVIEVYTEYGTERHFFAIIETPGTGNVFRIVYTAIVEFSLSCNLELFCVEEGSDDMFVVSEEQGTESASRFFILDRETILLCPRTNPPHKCVRLNDTTKYWKRNETGFIAM
jgi:hypothetical protein